MLSSSHDKTSKTSAGALYHVTSRVDRREDIYLDADNRKEWLQVLGHVCGRYNWVIHAYYQMTNHYCVFRRN